MKPFDGVDTVREKRIRHAEMCAAISSTIDSLEADGWTLSEMFGNFRLLTLSIAAAMRSRYRR